jgi:hypothetical protein
LDEAGINDDRDMLQELKLVLRAHRVPGMVDEDVPTMAQVLRMATVGGAKTTSFGTTIGSLEVGKAADLVLLDWKQISYPYLDEETPLLDAVIQRAKAEGVKLTMCDGEVIYEDGRFTRVDKEKVLADLHQDLQKALTHEESERRKLSHMFAGSMRTILIRRSTSPSTGRVHASDPAGCDDGTRPHEAAPDQRRYNFSTGRRSRRWEAVCDQPVACAALT